MADQLDKIVQVNITRQTSVPTMKSFSGHLVVSEDNPSTPGEKARCTLRLQNPTGSTITVQAQEYTFDDTVKTWTFDLEYPIVIPAGETKDIDVEADSAGYDERCVPGLLPPSEVTPHLDNDLVIEGTNNYKGKDPGKLFDATNRVVLYGSLDEIKDAGFPSTGFAYRAASKQFSQNPHIRDIYIGCKLPTDESWTDALDAIKSQNNDWYAVTVCARLAANQQNAAQWIQANEKLGALSTGDDTVVNADTGDIAAWANINNLDRVAIIYHPDAKLVVPNVDAVAPDDPIIEAAVFGLLLTKHPGSPTWKFKKFTSVPSYTLTQGQVTRVEKKKANWYMTVADVPLFSDGTMASGEYIDVIHGLDWLKARIANLVFMELVNIDKVPFTDEGVQIIVAALRKALDEGKQYQILAEFDIVYPAVADLAKDWKGKRTLPDVNFTGVLAGAIHRTIINGTITL